MSENTNTNENQNTNIGALWARESRNTNQKYLAGHVKMEVEGEEKTVKLVVFKNNRKEKENQPDYQIYKARPVQAQPEAATNNSDDLL
jgi:uncharacterized protein (DUF736 family)